MLRRLPGQEPRGEQQPVSEYARADTPEEHRLRVVEYQHIIGSGEVAQHMLLVMGCLRKKIVKRWHFAASEHELMCLPDIIAVLIGREIVGCCAEYLHKCRKDACGVLSHC